MGGMKKIWKNREMGGMGAKQGLYESIIVSKNMFGLTIWDRQTNDRIRRRTGVDLELSNRAEQRRVRWDAHMEIINDD